jgi:hypothetical protein
MTLASLKHHVALQPLFAIMAGGVVFVAVYVGRLALKGPDVQWKRHELNEPWDNLKDKQFKFFNPAGVDFSKFGTARPDYREGV